MGHSERQLKEVLGARFEEFHTYMYGKTVGICDGSSCAEAHGHVYYRGNVRDFLWRPERRDRLDLDDGGSWIVTTESRAFFWLRLDGDEKTIIRLVVDTGHTLPDGRHPLRRDGETLPPVDLPDPPIDVGKPARFVIGGVTSTQVTSPVIEIRRA